MSSIDTINRASRFDHELNEQELDKVTGGGGKTTTGKDATDRPSESLSLNFTKVVWTYTD
jgi:bacteriocin-like protein